MRNFTSDPVNSEANGKKRNNKILITILISLIIILLLILIFLLGYSISNRNARKEEIQVQPVIESSESRINQEPSVSAAEVSASDEFLTELNEIPERANEILYEDEKGEWHITYDGTLYINRTGEMDDYYDEVLWIMPPWAKYRDFIKSVVIADGVTRIAGRSFLYCDNLKSAVIPDSVTSIGGGAFSGTPYLDSLKGEFVIVGNNVLLKYNGTDKHVIIPEGVKYFSDFCPEEIARNIESVVIPRSVTTIGSYAFNCCGNLKSVTIPDNVTVIEDWAFWCSGIESIVIPNSVKTIGRKVFADSSIVNVSIPNSVEFIGGGAFQYTPFESACAQRDGFTIVGQNILFMYNGDDSHVVIPNGIKQIASAFEGENSIKTVVIPDGVTSIEDYAFGFCKGLESITIPDSVTSVKCAAFSDCDSLKTIKYNGSISQWNQIEFGPRVWENVSADVACSDGTVTIPAMRDTTPTGKVSTFTFDTSDTEKIT